MLAYLVIKVCDLIARGKIGYLTDGNIESYLFIAEIVIGITIPLIICFSRLANNRAWLAVFGVLTNLGLIFNRLNVVVTGMARNAGSLYLPAISEVIISLSLVAIGALVYLFVCENFPVLGKETHKYAN